jgi:hypothetical protein
MGQARAQFCDPSHVAAVSLPSMAGVSGAVSNDTAFNTFGKNYSYVVSGNTLYALDNLTSSVVWNVAFSAPIQNNAVPVPLTPGTGTTVTEAIFVSTLDGRVYGINAQDGGQFWKKGNGGTFFTVVGSGTASSCGTDVGSGDGLSAAPVIQLKAFANANVPNRDTVFVATRYGCGSAGNRIYALNAADGSQVWAFNKVPLYHVNAAYDSCNIVYDPTATAPPNNNLLICGTDQEPGYSSVWALNSVTGGVVWSTAGGPVKSRVSVKPAANRIYYGTLDSTIRVKSTIDGSDIYPPKAITSPVLGPVWPEFRPPTPGATNMIMFTTTDGLFRRITEETQAVAPTNYLQEQLTTPGRSSSGTPTFTSAPAMFPSAGKVYVGQSDGTVQQLETALGPSSPNASALVSSGPAFDSALDFNSLATSTDIDRLELASGATGGTVKRFCVPWGAEAGWVNIASVPGGAPPGPEPAGACGVGFPNAPKYAGDCLCDADCITTLKYAPNSACYQAYCEFRNGKSEGTCALRKSANGSACDNNKDGVLGSGVGKDDTGSCNCAPKYADASGRCMAACGPNGDGKNCDICMDGVCSGAARTNCGDCSAVGDRSGCGAGQSCCGGGNCANLLSDKNNCGACGKVCRPQEQCVSGACIRDPKYCNAADDRLLSQLGSTELIGAAAITYYDDAKNSGDCPAVISVNERGRGRTYVVSPGNGPKEVSTWRTAPGIDGWANGASMTPDGKFQAVVSITTDTQQIEWAKDWNPGGGTLDIMFQESIKSFTLPFPVPQFSSGYAANPAINVTNWLKTGARHIYVANFNKPGQVEVFIDGSDKGTIPVFGSGPQVTALGAGVRSQRWKNDNFVVAAIGSDIIFACNATQTNLGNGCRGNYPITVNLANPDRYANQDVNGAPYTASITRVFSIAVDPVNGNVYAEIGGLSADQRSLESQIVVIQESDLHFASPGSPTANLYATVRNVIDVENEFNLPTNFPKSGKFVGEFGGRLGIAANGLLTRIALPNKTGSVPIAFYSGFVP